MPTRESVRLYSESDLQNARTKGQIVGWAQGAGGMLLVGLAFKLIGWIPLVLVALAIAYVVYRMIRR